MVLRALLLLLLIIQLTGCATLDKRGIQFEQQHRSVFLTQNGAQVCDHNSVYGPKPPLKINDPKKDEQEEIKTAKQQKKHPPTPSLTKRGHKVAIKTTPKKYDKLVAFAKKYNRYRRVPKPFRNDCSGFIRFALNHINIDPFKLDVVKENGKWINGTKLVRNYALKHGSVFKNWKKVRPGDLIFFDNTHDKNRNRKLDDYFTHIALVVEKKPDGTIEYIHKSNRGINIQKMNLIYPHQVYRKVGRKKFKVNSYLRPKSRRDVKSTPHLSAEMFRSFGRIGIR